jgi:hypothetical protein
MAFSAAVENDAIIEVQVKDEDDILMTGNPRIRLQQTILIQQHHE